MKHRIVCLFILFISLCAKTTYATSLYTTPCIQDDTATELSQELQKDTSPLSPITLDQEKIQEYQNDDDFNYVEVFEENETWANFKQWIYDILRSIFEWIFDGEEAVGALATFIKSLPYIVGGLLLILTIWTFSKMDSGQLLFNKKPSGPQIIMSDDEELINHQDIQSLIDEAIASGNHRLAIRFYYLLALQKMSGKELIDWQAQKTNHEYIYEVKDQQLRMQFRHITDLYDYIWYGNFEVDALSFKKAQSSFLTLTNTL